MVLRTGFARFPSTDYKTTNHIIAYLDILGATNKICNDNDFSFLNHLNMFMEDAIEESGEGIFPHASYWCCILSLSEEDSSIEFTSFPRGVEDGS